MAEASVKKPAEAKPGEKKAKKGPSAASLLAADKGKKAAWSLERCLKAAKRFSSESEWAAGAPAAYKSATAHGWLPQCTAKMVNQKSGRKSA